MSPRVRRPARSLDHQCARSSSDPYCTWRQIASHTKTSLAAGSRLEAVLLPLACLLCGAASLTPRRSAGSQRLRPISSMSYRRSAHVGRSSFTTGAGIARGPSRPASNFFLRGRSSASCYPSMTAEQPGAGRRVPAPLSEISGVTPAPAKCSVTTREKATGKGSPSRLLAREPRSSASRASLLFCSRRRVVKPPTSPAEIERL